METTPVVLSRVKRWLGLGPLSDEQFEQQRRALLTQTPVPVFWLFGKTGSGKSSIVRYLTGASSVAIGNGYRPQTTTAAQYDFPSSDQPLVRFLDTRGLAEARYDPTEDIAAAKACTHLMIVTARVTDQALEPVLVPLREIKQAAPSRPIVLALTCLHQTYPQGAHPQPDPFTSDSWRTDERLPENLRRCLLAQEQRFAGLVDRIVPIDLTQSEEGFEPVDFGGDRLEQALQDLLPAAYRHTLLHLPELRLQLQDLTERQALPVILSYSSLAATAAATPFPWVDIPVVLGLQSRLVYLLADLYGQRLQGDLLWQMASAVGGRLLVRFAVKAPLKFLPVVGQTANAAMAFAYTYSLGKACCWYFGQVKAGHVPSQDELSAVWSEKLTDAVAVWKRQERSKP
jgi:uncharacterized protein (DUF697 family)/predicted GTPase